MSRDARRAGRPGDGGDPGRRRESGGGATKCAPVPGRPEDCSFTTSSGLGPLGVAAIVVGLAAPLATSVYLARRARLRPAA